MIVTKPKKDPWPEFSQSHYFERLLTHPDLHYKKMFGGLALYLGQQMVAVLMENADRSIAARTWKGKDYGFSIWNGVLLPTSREHHTSLQATWPELVPHPVLGKWLFLHADEPSFETVIEEVVQQIRRQDPRLGIQAGTKKRSKS